jgi:hypothetical protein
MWCLRRRVGPSRLIRHGNPPRLPCVAVQGCGTAVADVTTRPGAPGYAEMATPTPGPRQIPCARGSAAVTALPARTTGRLWKQSTVSGLLKGRYDRSGGTSVR